MREYIEQRATELAIYIINNKATVRSTAKKFCISKSTVHKDVTERLWEINKSLARQVKAVLQTNKINRHIRGGEATKNKYLKAKGIC